MHTNLLIIRSCLPLGIPVFYQVDVISTGDILPQKSVTNFRDVLKFI